MFNQFKRFLNRNRIATIRARIQANHSRIDVCHDHIEAIEAASSSISADKLHDNEAGIRILRAAIELYCEEIDDILECNDRLGNELDSLL